MNESEIIPDAIALTEKCFCAFEAIGRTGKPILYKEWTVLSCIVKYDHQTKEMDVISIGTGD